MREVWDPPGAGAASPHDLTGADHNDSGLTEGMFFRATAATTFAWEQVVFTYLFGLGNAGFTNLGAGPTEPAQSGVNIRLVLPDLSRFTELRMVGVTQTVGATGDMKFQYSTDDSTWVDLQTNLYDLSLAAGPHATAWEAIPAGAQADLIVVRLVAVNGNGTEDPVVRGVELQVR